MAEEKTSAADKARLEELLAQAAAPKKRFKGYARFKNSLKSVCQYLVLDGQFETFSAIVEKNAVKDADCVSCKPFFELWSTACAEIGKVNNAEKLKKVKPTPTKIEADGEAEIEAEQAEPAPTPTVAIIKRMEPHSLVIEALIELAQQIQNDDPSQISHHMRSLNKLFANLEPNKFDNLIDKTYYSFFANALQSPLARELKDFENMKKEQEKEKISKEKQEQLDQIFGN